MAYISAGYAIAVALAQYLIGKQRESCFHDHKTKRIKT